MKKLKTSAICVVMSLFSLSFIGNLSAQDLTKLSDQQLLSEGHKALNNNDYKTAALCYFAVMMKYPNIKTELGTVYDYAFKRVTNGVGVKSDGSCDCQLPNNNYKPEIPSASIPASAPATTQPVSNPVTSVVVSTLLNSTLTSGRMWICDDGGFYFITVINNEVWWHGDGRNKGFHNVMHGTITGNIITGAWADVPPGSAKSSGNIVLQIDNANSFHVTSATGGFGGKTWKVRSAGSTAGAGKAGE
jgi:hypothetical protein